MQVMIFGVIVYAGILFFIDLASLKEVFLILHWNQVPYILGLVALSYMLRFYRWQSYLKGINTSIRWQDSLIVFFCGIAMAITPGKAGELIKSYILQKKYSVRYSDSVPVVLAERLTDLMALLFSICVTVINNSLLPRSNLLLGVVLLTLFATFFGWPILTLLIKKTQKYSFMARYYHKLQPIKDSIDTIMHYPFMLKMFGISLISWFIQSLAAYLIFSLLLNMPLTLADTILILSLSTLAGALSMLPAGIGIFEGSMIAVLVLANVDNAIAVAATVLSRVFILWSGVIAGSLVLQINMKYLGLSET